MARLSAHGTSLEDDLPFNAACRKKLQRLPGLEKRKCSRDHRVDLLRGQQGEDLRQILAERGGIASIEGGDAVEAPAPSTEARTEEKIDEHREGRERPLGGHEAVRDQTSTRTEGADARADHGAAYPIEDEVYAVRLKLPHEPIKPAASVVDRSRTELADRVVLAG